MRTVLEFKRFCHDAGLDGHFLVSSDGFTVTLRSRVGLRSDTRYVGEAQTLPWAVHLAIERYLAGRPKEISS